MTVVAVIMRLHRWRAAHQGGIRPIVTKVGVDWRSVWVVRPVLQRRALVLFAPDTTHRQACREDEGSMILL